MIKQTITYTDFNGNEGTEDLYFHISKTVLADNLELREELEGLANMSLKEKRDLTTAEIKKLISIVKTFMRLGYGIRSEDGQRFKQSPEIWEDFTWSPAYDAFLYSLFVDPDKATEFLMGILPTDLREQAEKEIAEKEKAEKKLEKAPKKD